MRKGFAMSAHVSRWFAVRVSKLDPKGRRLLESLGRGVAELLLLLIAVLPLLYVVTGRVRQLPEVLQPEQAMTWVRLLAAVTLAFFPGWLFIRFMKARGPALWDEYVMNLHRLGLDDRAYLPRPSPNSEYYPLWEDRLREVRSDLANRRSGWSTLSRQPRGH